jgi:hypothetical protein
MARASGLVSMTALYKKKYVSKFRFLKLFSETLPNDPEIELTGDRG